MYKYQTEKPVVFTDDGQRHFLAIRDWTLRACTQSGAFSMHCALHVKGPLCGTWEIMACVDRLVELGEITEITGPETAGQRRVFVRRF